MLVAYVKRQRTLEAVRPVEALAVPPAKTPPPSAGKPLAPASHLPRDAKRKRAGATDAAYTAAFARVRLVRAWIGVAAATVALGYAFAALLDRVLP